MQGQTKQTPLYFVGMQANPLAEQVWRLAEPLCTGEGMDLVHVEYQRESNGRTLRIYLDKPGGVTLDDCVAISRQLSDLLDVGLETDQAYRLEVSSPGTQRPLGKIDDFERFKGCRIKIRTARSVHGRKHFTGLLDSVSGLNIQLKIDNQPMSIAFADISKAYLINQNGEDACL